MISYKDMTFCRGDGCADFNKCPRALTDAVKLGAKAWWGGRDDAPIAEFANPKALKCYAPQPEDSQ